MKKLASRSMVLILGLAAASWLAACGTGNEPFSTLGDPQATPLLEFPLSANAITANTSFLEIAPYGTKLADSSIADGFEFGLFSTFNFNQATDRTIVAPASGIVTAVDAGLDSGTVAITIQHSPRLTTRINRVSGTGLPVGTYVVGGQTVLGTAVATSFNLVRMTVIFDGAVVCPYSYFSPTARVQANQFLRLQSGLPQQPCLQ